MNPSENRESEKDHHVTIPYFLYEAMARAYYSQERNVDIPVQAPSQFQKEEGMNMKGMYFNPMDIPPNWKPGGVASKEQIDGVSSIQTTEEED